MTNNLTIDELYLAVHFNIQSNTIRVPKNQNRWAERAAASARFLLDQGTLTGFRGVALARAATDRPLESL